MSNKPNAGITNSTLRTGASLRTRTRETKGPSATLLRGWNGPPVDKFGQKLGIEFTFLSSEIKWANTFAFVEHYRKLRNSVEWEMKKQGIPIWAVWHDPGCIEIPSPPMESLTDLHAWWVRTHEVTGSFRLRTWKEGEMSGGGHIHLERTSNDRALGNLVRHVHNRPWLNWVFNHHWDTDQANWLGGSPFARAICRHPDIDGQNPWPTRHDYALTIRDDTVELRFFDMPRDWHETVAMAVFADRYYGMVKAFKGTIKARKITSAEGKWGLRVTSFTKRQCINEFKELLAKLGLNYSDYRGFVERNLNARFEDRNLLT